MSKIISLYSTVYKICFNKFHKINVFFKCLRLESLKIMQTKKCSSTTMPYFRLINSCYLTLTRHDDDNVDIIATTIVPEISCTKHSFFFQSKSLRLRLLLNGLKTMEDANDLFELVCVGASFYFHSISMTLRSLVLKRTNLFNTLIHYCIDKVLTKIVCCNILCSI